MQKTSLENRGASIAVSNTSPLIALKQAELVEKLNLLFQRIIVPPSVMRELGFLFRAIQQAVDPFWVQVLEPLSLFESRLQPAGFRAVVVAAFHVVWRVLGFWR